MSIFTPQRLEFLKSQWKVWPTSCSILKYHASSSQVMSASIRDGGTVTFGFSEIYSCPCTVYVTSPTFSSCLIKDLVASFVLLKHKSSESQIWRILFPEKVETEFVICVLQPEITQILTCSSNWKQKGTSAKNKYELVDNYYRFMIVVMWKNSIVINGDVKSFGMWLKKPYNTSNIK